MDTEWRRDAVHCHAITETLQSCDGPLAVTFLLWLFLGSGVLHRMDGMEALDLKRLFPKILHQSRPSWKAYKNNLLRKN